MIGRKAWAVAGRRRTSVQAGPRRLARGSRLVAVARGHWLVAVARGGWLVTAGSPASLLGAALVDRKHGPRAQLTSYAHNGHNIIDGYRLVGIDDNRWLIRLF